MEVELLTDTYSCEDTVFEEAYYIRRRILQKIDTILIYNLSPLFPVGLDPFSN